MICFRLRSNEENQFLHIVKKYSLLIQLLYNRCMLAPCSFIETNSIEWARNNIKHIHRGYYERIERYISTLIIRKKIYMESKGVELGFGVHLCTILIEKNRMRMSCCKRNNVWTGWLFNYLIESLLKAISSCNKGYGGDTYVDQLI